MNLEHQGIKIEKKASKQRREEKIGQTTNKGDKLVIGSSSRRRRRRNSCALKLAGCCFIELLTPFLDTYLLTRTWGLVKCKSADEATVISLQESCR